MVPIRMFMFCRYVFLVANTKNPSNSRAYFVIALVDLCYDKQYNDDGF